MKLVLRTTPSQSFIVSSKRSWSHEEEIPKKPYSGSLMVGKEHELGGNKVPTHLILSPLPKNLQEQASLSSLTQVPSIPPCVLFVPVHFLWEKCLLLKLQESYNCSLKIKTEKHTHTIQPNMFSTPLKVLPIILITNIKNLTILWLIILLLCLQEKVSFFLKYLKRSLLKTN